ncbi:alpha/beta fold hydrolase [Bifidobacterium parmae]|uniref:GPI inositol-deacylase PGAP1-like alpha/beta domain-containing protein n=1 Tax=Bifidobacterium parmae TaxID=361854 RepID=A0A2N5J465_9BIFI|nr:alpha/beta fold hydrolase [Bifidobacterium parmae]PLS29011.1 hypothetical protein Uis4E_0948 [Bifidobacterium parmae]
MGWQIVSRVHGGHQSAPATVEEFQAAQAALEDAYTELTMHALAWSKAATGIASDRTSVPLCPMLSSGASSMAGKEHTTLPYDRLIAVCQQRAAEINETCSRIRGMEDLLVRANGLYSEAERTARRVVTEGTQAVTREFPVWATAAMIGGISGGLLYGGAVEHAFTPGYSSWITAQFQEGYVSGIAARLVGVDLKDGILQTDEVGQAAGKIGTWSGPLKDFYQGNELTVRRVDARADVVGRSRSVGESLENLRRLGEERLGKIDLDSGLAYGTVAVQRYEKADGTNAWLVTVPGTDGQWDSPFGWEQNIELMSDDAERRRQADSARMVVEAMEQAGIGRDEPVAIVGHSQGGIVAAAIASDESERFDIQHIVTAGSPVANHPIPEHTWVTSIEIEDEFVASLDGAENPANEHWLTIRGTLEPSPDTGAPRLGDDGVCVPGTDSGVWGDSPYAGAPVDDPAETKEMTHWLKYHQAAYQNATDLGGVPTITHERHFAGVIDGELKETQYYEGRISYGRE